MFFSGNVSRADVDNADYPKSPLFVQSEATILIKSKRLHKWTSYTKKETGLSIGSNLKQICKSLERCEKLIKLQISAVCHKSLYWMRILTKLSEPFAELRGSGKVIFTEDEINIGFISNDVLGRLDKLHV